MIKDQEIVVTPKMVEAGATTFRRFINTDRYDPIYEVEEIVTFIFAAGG